MIIALTIIIILLILALVWATQDRNNWKKRYNQKVSYIFSTDYEIGKEINCIDHFYAIYDNKVGKFKTTGLELELTDNEDGFPIYKITNVEGKCVEGPGYMIDDTRYFTSKNIFLSKKSLLENL